MKRSLTRLRDFGITIGLLLLAFLLSLLFQHVFAVEEHVTTVFVFAVFLISLWTEGYFWGISAAFVGTLAVHFAFTFPYFTLNLPTPVNIISAAIMIIIALMTGALTTKIKRQEMLRAEGEKERVRANLLRAVSHDLRTPLTAIYGAGTTLLEHRELTEAQQTEMLASIKEESEWLMRMVENLLSVTRFSGGVQILKSPTVLEELIDAAILQFRGRFPGIPIEFHIPEQITLIPMDATLIRQVIANMLENAVRHAEGMTQLSLIVTVEEGIATFEIRDNGCGIQADRLDRIFDGYTDPGRAADSRKRNAGIGLSVCATIIRAHGGQITAENAPQGGAVFRFTLSTEEPEIDEE